MPTLRKIFFLLLAIPRICCADQESLSQAEKLYQSGEWEKARQLYKAELGATPDASHLPPAFFYNYGTAAAKAGAIGEAYVALLRAASSRPLDSDSRANLKLVQRQVPAAVLAVQPSLWFSWWPSELRNIPWRAWALLTLLCLAVVLWKLGTAGRAFPSGLSAALALLCLTAGLAWAQERLPVYGVIAPAKVKSGPGGTYSDITTLDPGSLVNQEATREGWLKIRFAKLGADVETVGWLEPGTVLEVRRN